MFVVFTYLNVIYAPEVTIRLPGLLEAVISLLISSHGDTLQLLLIGGQVIDCRILVQPSLVLKIPEQAFVDDYLELLEVEFGP